MPRENRKRGKKNKSKQVGPAEDHVFYEDHSHIEPEELKVHSSAPGPDTKDPFPEAPFGPLDPDVKAYFRTVDDQLREWQEEGLNPEVEADVDPNEERRMFFTAALAEMRGKELQLATDPECSPVLERMLYSMDDFVRRVFTDSLAGSWSQLITNRFASHVCQTLCTLAADTVARETRGTLAPAPDSAGRGELLTMTQLILNACEDITPELPSLIQSPFASHVLRALLILLAPSQLAPSPSRSHKHAPSARSKKSASWKARHGPMKAVILDESRTSYLNGRGTVQNVPLIPDAFTHMAGKFVSQVRISWSGNEVRALAVDKVASPVLQMVLELEVATGQADSSDSVMDRVLAGLVTESHTTVPSSPSPYVSTLLLDATSSHLSESIFSHCPSCVFDRLWDCYISLDLPKLAVHPVANFVVARGMERLDEMRLGNAMTQLHPTWSKALKLSRMGVLTAMVDRGGQIGAHEAEIVDAMCSMVELDTEEDRKSLVQCVLPLKTLREYKDALARIKVNQEDGPSAEFQIHGSLEPKTQGSILLQSVLRLHEPYNSVALESLFSLLPTELLALAQSATSSRVLDAVFESPRVPLRARKRLVTSFIGHFHLLVDDRIGSRVADRCWEAADPYLKEKIARSLIPHEQFLAGSHFGRFFTRSLSLPLLQRKPDQWKALQAKNRQLLTDANAIPNSIPHVQSTGGAKRKRTGNAGEDEIDALFSNIGAKKRSKGATETLADGALSITKGDAALESVLGAIKTAPQSDPRSKRHKK